MKNQRVLVLGGGIAGPTLAFWLARYGFRPTVVERAADIRLGGNGVDVRGQGLEVATAMGILPRIRERATDIIGMSFVDANGRSVARMDLRALQEKAGSGEVELMRGDLATILYEKTRDDVEYLFGDSVQTLEQNAITVTVQFATRPPREFDLVIGADGVHSAVRRIAFAGADTEAKYLHHCFAFANGDERLGENRWVTVYNEPGRMAGVYRSGAHRGAKANFAWYRRGPIASSGGDVERQKKWLREAFTGAGWRVAELLECAVSDPDFYFDTLTQVRLRSWSVGRIALAGDAAHCASPVSGAGATLALVGAYRLAGELAAASGDHRVAFRRYEEGYRKTVEDAQASLFLGLVVPRTRVGIWTRNVLVRSPLLAAFSGLERRLQPKTKALPPYRLQAPAG